MSADWERRSPAEQRRVQGLILGRWIGEVAAYSPFWRQHLARAGVDPDTVEERSDLEALPPVRELDVLGAGGPGSPDLLLRPTESQVKAQASLRTLWRIARSTRGEGAGGKRRALLTEYKPLHLVRSGRDGRLVVAYTRSDLDRLHRAGARTAAVLGLDADDYLVSAVPAADRLEFWGLYHLALGASLLALHPRRSGAGLDEVARGLELVPATAVAVTVREAVELAAELTERGAPTADIRTVLVVGPPPTDERRAEIRDAWRAAGADVDVSVLALWGPTAGRLLWGECAPGSGLHTYPDLELVELLEPATSTPVDEGGELTYSSIGWNGTGLVRFETGDYAGTLTREACPSCGRTTPRVLPPVLVGAWEPELDTGGGPVRVDLRGAAKVLEGEPSVDAWRVEIRGRTSRRRDEVYVVHVAGDADDERLGELGRRAALAAGHAPLEIAVDDPADIQAHVEEAGSVFLDRR